VIKKSVECDDGTYSKVKINMVTCKILSRPNHNVDTNPISMICCNVSLAEEATHDVRIRQISK